MTTRAGIVIIGLGNVICSDDGLGVHALRRLRDSHSLADDISLIEGGTAGLLLLPHLADANRVIIMDAIDMGATPGTLVRLDGLDWGSAFAHHMSPHDLGLADLLGAAQLSGAWPNTLVLHGIQPASTALGTTLTPSVAEAVDELISVVVAELDRWTSALSAPSPHPADSTAVMRGAR
jgi:hydrogenase maturation protease